MFLARQIRAYSAVSHSSASAMSRRDCGHPVPMGACFEKASGGASRVGSSLYRRKWIGDGVVGRLARGGEKTSWEVRRRSGRRQLRRYTVARLVCGYVVVWETH